MFDIHPEIRWHRQTNVLWVVSFNDGQVHQSDHCKTVDKPTASIISRVMSRQSPLKKKQFQLKTSKLNITPNKQTFQTSPLSLVLQIFRSFQPLRKTPSRFDSWSLSCEWRQRRDLSTTGSLRVLLPRIRGTLALELVVPDNPKMFVGKKWWCHMLAKWDSH